jgi:hypothetical protein
LDSEQVGFGGRFERDAMPALAERFGFLADGRHQWRHRHALFADVLLRFQTRQREQVFDDLAHALGLRAHFAQYRRQFRHVFRIDQFEITVNHRQRRAQFVRDVGDEVAANLFQPRHVTDIARQQQTLVATERQQRHVDMAVGMAWSCDIVERFVRTVFQPAGQLGGAQALMQVRAAIMRAAQAEQILSRMVEPADMLMTVQQHDGIRKAAGGAAQITQTGGDTTRTRHETVMLQRADAGDRCHHELCFMTNSSQQKDDFRNSDDGHADCDMPAREPADRAAEKQRGGQCHSKFPAMGGFEHVVLPGLGTVKHRQCTQGKQAAESSEPARQRRPQVLAEKR